VSHENADGGTSDTLAPFEARRARTWVIVAAVAVAALRLYECGLLPTETGDIVRNVLYGVAVDSHGVSAASRPLTELSSAW